MPTPSSYASRYLPVNVPNGLSFIPVRIERYHLGPPSTPAQQQLWSALGDHFSQQKKKNPGYELTLTVNSAPFSVGSREQIRMPSVRPFWGKGSPEDCQVVLQLALLFNLTTALNLQKVGQRQPRSGLQRIRGKLHVSRTNWESVVAAKRRR